MTNGNAMIVPTHGDKLKALLSNHKLPSNDVPKVEQAIEKYNQWLNALKSVQGNYNEVLGQMVQLFNDYKFHIDFELIYNNESDFLYRQKGQLKLDNTIIEEFLPYLVQAIFASEFRDKNLTFGPATCFSSVHFESSILSDEPGAGMKLHQKDQDFVISKKIYIKVSQQSDFNKSVTEATHVAYVATECKTNLDKTMFQEAAATALDLKKSVPTAKYYLLCDWLDMTPISTGTTAIDEIIILRKAKRLSSNIRSDFSTYEGRKSHLEEYKSYLINNPFSATAFDRFLTHIKHLIQNGSEEEILSEGYF